MSASRRMLLVTLAGHFAWLEDCHPKKANAPIARKARRYVRQTLRERPVRG